MKIKKGDMVRVISGDDKGVIAEVIKAYPTENKVIVEGVRLMKKALKPSQANPDGGMVEMEGKIHVSNVVLHDAKKEKAKAKKAPAKKVAAKKAVAPKAEAVVEEKKAPATKAAAKKTAAKKPAAKKE